MSQNYVSEQDPGLTPAEHEFVAALRNVEAAPFAFDAVDLAFRAGCERGRLESAGRARAWRVCACAASVALAGVTGVWVLGFERAREPEPGLSEGTRLAAAGTAPPAGAFAGGEGRTSAPMSFIPSAGSSRRVPSSPGSAIDRLLSMGVLP